MRIKGSDLRRIIKEEIYRSGRLNESFFASLPTHRMGDEGQEVRLTQWRLAQALRKIGEGAVDLPSNIRDSLVRLGQTGKIAADPGDLADHVVGLAEAIEETGPDGKFGPMTKLATMIVQSVPYRVYPGGPRAMSITGEVDQATREVLSKAPTGDLSNLFLVAKLMKNVKPDDLLAAVLGPDMEEAAAAPMLFSDARKKSALMSMLDSGVTLDQFEDLEALEQALSSTIRGVDTTGAAMIQKASTSGRGADVSVAVPRISVPRYDLPDSDIDPFFRYGAPRR